MVAGFTWPERTRDLRHQLHVVDAIDAAGLELTPDASVETVTAALNARGLGFIHAIIGLVVIKDVAPGDAKWLIHQSQAYAGDREDREAFWAALYEEATRMPEVQQQSTAADPTEPPDAERPDPS